MKILQKGFTLIELMIVLVIIGLIGGIGVPTYLTYQENAKRKTTEANLRSLNSAIVSYEMMIGKYPDILDDLVKRPSDKEAAEKWSGSLLSKIPRDGWGKPFIYNPTPGAEQPYELYSKGKDAKSKLTA